MNDTTIPLTPTWLLALQSRIISAYSLAQSAPVGVVMQWMGAPIVSDCPTPGQARNWTHDMWKEWAAAHGYVYDSHTAHSHLYRHSVIDHLRFGVATSPGDWRTPMAMAKDVRSGVREAAELVYGFSVAAVGFGLNAATFADADEDASRRIIGGIATAVLANRLTKVEALKQIVHTCADGSNLMPRSEELDDLIKRTMVRAENTRVPVDELNARLRSLKNEFDIGPKQALRQTSVFRARVDALDRFLELLKLCRPGEQVTAHPALPEELADLLDLLREQERVEKAERKSQKAKEDTPAPRTLRETTQEAFDRRRADFLQLLQGQEKLAQSLVDRVRMSIQSLPVFPLPDMADPAALDAAAAAVAAHVAENAALRAEVTTLKQQLAEADNAEDLTAHLAAARAFADVTVETLKQAPNQNSFAMVKALQELQAQAEELRVTLAPAKAQAGAA